MTVRFRIGRRKRLVKNIREAAQGKPFYALVGASKPHPIPADLIAVVVREEAGEALRIKDHRVVEGRIPKEDWGALPCLTLNYRDGFAALRANNRRIQWKEGRLK